jgi:hypothetical protein
MLRRVTLVRTDVSEELSASFIRVTTIGELGTTLAVTSNRRAAKKCQGVSWKKRCIEGTYRLHHHGKEIGKMRTKIAVTSSQLAAAASYS